jgi:hypothetical protein
VNDVPRTNGDDWTLSAYVAHNEALREAEARFQDERDRRYKEIAEERAKALQIKEQADRDALGLAREIQTYKDEKANELREQISAERGNYATKGDLSAAIDKIEAIIKPLADFVASQQGRERGISLSTGVIATAITMAIAAAGFIYLVGS